MLELEGLGKRYGAHWAVRGLDLRIAAGELVALVGGSGSGKTTALKLINRLLEATEGRVLLDGEDIAKGDPVELRRRIGYVIQGVGLLPHRTIAENIATVPLLLGWDRARIRARVAELLVLMGLPADCGPRYPAQLSGGQRQRVGVARALAAEQRILLMDEPFGALDPLTRDELQQALRRLHRELGLTVVLVTHDMAEALLLGDRVGVMQGGRLVACDAPTALLQRPPDAYTAALLEVPRRRAEEVALLVGGGGKPPPPQENKYRGRLDCRPYS
jgi:osmoprotectant transport system ATP-binding protein